MDRPPLSQKRPSFWDSNGTRDRPVETASFVCGRRLARQRTVHAARLCDEPLIETLGPQVDSLYLASLVRDVSWAPRTIRQAQSLTDALGLAAAGFGVALVKPSELRLHPEGLRPLAEQNLTGDRHHVRRRTSVGIPRGVCQLRDSEPLVRECFSIRLSL